MHSSLCIHLSAFFPFAPDPPDPRTLRRAWNVQSMLGLSITEPSQAQLWYSGMADAAAARNVTVQYCLGDPSDLLVSLTFPAVSNARASFDYCDTARNI